MYGEKFGGERNGEGWDFSGQEYNPEQARMNRQEARENPERENLIEGLWQKIASNPEFKKGMGEILAALAAAGMLIGMALWDKGESQRDVPPTPSKYEEALEYDLQQDAFEKFLELDEE